MTDRYINKLVHKLINKKCKELIDDSKVKVQNWQEMLSKIDNIPLVNVQDDDTWWVQDGYLHGTGKYIPIIEKLIKEQEQ